MAFLIVPAVYLVLIKRGRTLLLRRKNTGYEDGNYSLVAGHVEAGETATEAVIREAWEEAGIRIQAPELVHLMYRRGPSDVRADMFFRAQAWKGRVRNREPKKCDEIEWYKLDSLPKNTIPYIKQALRCIQKGTTYSEHGFTRLRPSR